MEYLGYMAARDTGVLAPPARLVEVFVNGQAAISGGELTGRLPGRVLQRR